MATGQAPESASPLRDFLDDWRIHLRAKNRSRGTIDSYLTCGEALCDWLEAENLPTEHAPSRAARWRPTWRPSRARLASHHRRATDRHFRHLQANANLDQVDPLPPATSSAPRSRVAPG